MESIQTTGGIYTDEIKKTILKNICSVFSCEENEIYDLIPVIVNPKLSHIINLKMSHLSMC